MSAWSVVPCGVESTNGRSPGDRTEERGQALPLVALVLVLVVVVSLLLAAIGDAVIDRSRAQTAADAAALAGAAEGRAAAERLATANGAILVSFDPGPPVEVVVEIDGRRARARAEKRLRFGPP